MVKNKLFKLLLSIFITISKLYASSADVVVFSYDRPMQLHAFLETFFEKCCGYGHVQILYKTSGKEFEKGYQIVKGYFPKAQFIKETNFRKQTLELSFSSPHTHIVYAVDDIYVKEPINFSKDITILQKTNAYGLFYRLGLNIDFCYAHNKAMPSPPYEQVGKNIYRWRFSNACLDWKYPNNLDFTLYEKQSIKLTIMKRVFTYPNDFEGSWAALANMRKMGICYEKSKIVNVPLNVVSRFDTNPQMNLYTKYELLNLYLCGEKIDVRPIYRIDNNSAHFEWTPKFIKR